MKLIATLSLVVCLAAAAFAEGPVPRRANEFTITRSTGAEQLYKNSRGKVVVVQFLYTTCIHCQETARMLSKLEADYKSRGLEVLGVAFNPEARDVAVIQDFKSANGVTFPVGSAPLESVLGYLGISVMERFVVPQILIVDRAGMIRAQSAPLGSPELQDEEHLRTFLGTLLKERAIEMKKPGATGR